MTQEQKQLLIKDICARLPYGLKFQSYHSECGVEGNGTFDFEIGNDVTLSKLKHLCESGNNKPYLRPMSSMTEEEYLKYSETRDWRYVDDDHYEYFDTLETFDWLLAHHFDYRGLIEKGLALEALPGMYKIE